MRKVTMPVESFTLVHHSEVAGEGPRSTYEKRRSLGTYSNRATADKARAKIIKLHHAAGLPVNGWLSVDRGVEIIFVDAARQ